MRVQNKRFLREKRKREGKVSMLSFLDWLIGDFLETFFICGIWFSLI